MAPCNFSRIGHLHGVVRRMDTIEDDVEAATEYLGDFGYVGTHCTAILGYLQVMLR